MPNKLTITIGLAAVLALALAAELVPIPKVMAQQFSSATQSACIQSANSLFNQQLSQAIQLITRGTLTHHPELVTQGTALLNQAISTYHAALVACITIHR